MSNYRLPPSSLPDLAFVDVETTGLDPDEGHRVIEVAVRRVSFNPATWNDPLAAMCFRITPDGPTLAAASPEALKVNGYYEGHPDWEGAPMNDTPEANKLWGQVAKMLHKAVLVSQNVPFDRGFLHAELLRAGKLSVNPYTKKAEGPWARRFLDIQSYSFGVALERGLTLWGLHDVYAALGLPALKEHRAEADIARGMAVMKHVLDRFMAASKHT